ncbi:hypothetical protein HMPREF1990_00904 [Porphyromonas gingivalis W4087]|nr:hypothetical protein HMPREF1990_00904 [Porphyromonas gingivalis W4087]
MPQSTPLISKSLPIHLSLKGNTLLLNKIVRKRKILVEIRRVPNSRLTHNKKNKQKCLLIVQSSHLDVTSLGTKTNYPYGRGCSKPL